MPDAHAGAPALLLQLTHALRTCGPQLLAATAQPHDELLTLVWGPRFDRERALTLAARGPQHAAHTVPALLQAADAFDQLHGGAQQRLRRMILRHQAQLHSVTMPSHAPHPAH